MGENEDLGRLGRWDPLVISQELLLYLRDIVGPMQGNAQTCSVNLRNGEVRYPSGGSGNAA